MFRLCHLVASRWSGWWEVAGGRNNIIEEEKEEEKEEEEEEETIELRRRSKTQQPRTNMPFVTQYTIYIFSQA